MLVEAVKPDVLIGFLTRQLVYDADDWWNKRRAMETRGRPVSRQLGDLDSRDPVPRMAVENQVKRTQRAKHRPVLGRGVTSIVVSVGL